MGYIDYVPRRQAAVKGQEGLMNITDTIALVLKSKSENRVLSIAPEASVYEALEKMAKHDVGALLVVSGGRLAGILSERDYARKGVLLGLSSRDSQVRQIMTSPVVFVSPQQTVDECMAIMTQHHFRHLPVLQDGAVVADENFTNLLVDIGYAYVDPRIRLPHES